MEAAPALLRSLEALAEPSRLRLLRLLDLEELTVGDLARCTELPQSSVSRHLAALRKAGLVVERTEGVRSFVRRAESKDPVVQSVVESFRSPGFGHDDDLRALERLRAEREREHESSFDRLAGDWDAVREELLGGRPSPADIATLLLPRGMHIVDAGTGTGLMLPWLSQVAGPDGRVIAIERSAAMAQHARERAAGLANVEVRRGRIEDPPVDAGWADAVILSLSLGHVRDAGATLSACGRACKSGGRVIVMDVESHGDAKLVDRLGPGFRGFTESELLATMTRAGLDEPRRVPLAAPAGGMNGGRTRVSRNFKRLSPLCCVGLAPDTRRRTRGGETRRNE